MRLIYICYMNLGISGSVGILKKIHSQISQFEKNGISVDFLYPENRVIKLENSSEKVIEVPYNSVDSAARRIADKVYDCAYIRLNSYISFGLLTTIKELKKSGLKILIEIPTYPFTGEMVYHIKESLHNFHIPGVIKKLGILAINYRNAKKIHKYTDAIVTYSRDTEIWGIPAISIPNGIDVDSVSLADKAAEPGTIRAICVSSCVTWHGYDRFIEGMHNYYADNSSPDTKVYFDIVGEGPESGNYSDLIKRYGLGEYIKLYGNRKGVELDRLYENADIAVDAMGRHRVGVEYNSSLKGKEYAARGLPIVSGVCTELDYAVDYPYYLRVPADDTPIDINEVINFYSNVKSMPDYHNTIREYARTNFSYDVSYRPVVDYIKNN